MKRAVQQTLTKFTKTSVLNGGISKYNFSYPALSDTEEEKDDSKIGENGHNPGSNPMATRGMR